MPVRTIRKIEEGLDGSKEGELALRVPKAIINSIRLEKGDVFVCEFKKHFDHKQKLIKELSETIEIRCENENFDSPYYESSYLSYPHIIILTDLDIMKKYGFLENEYLEVIFKEVKRNKESISIFPERMIEDSAF